MTAVQANGITIEYDETGPRDAPVVLLIIQVGALCKARRETEF